MSAPPASGVVAKFQHRGQDVQFFIQDAGDLIQSSHASGRFYEPVELEMIERRLRPGGVYLDIGANIGNHLVFVGRFCGQKALLAIEPNPPAVLLLRLNLMLNDLEADLQHLGLALSDAEGAGIMAVPSGNLGAARMWPLAEGPVKVVTGDSLFAGQAIDFIKIDVESHELQVLAGLARTIAANRPDMFIEVDDVNRTGFDAWVAAHDYTVVETFRRYPVNENVMVTPREGRAYARA